MLSGCTPTQEDPVTERTRDTLSKLPTCEDSSVAGPLTIVWSFTNKHCGEENPCCNSHRARRAIVSTPNGDVNVEGTRLHEVFGLDAYINECDSPAIDAASKNVSLSLAEPACVVR